MQHGHEEARDGEAAVGGRAVKLDWSHRFLLLAAEVATWSKDPSTKVGCVIARDKQVISLGYNGFPRGIADDDRLEDRDQKYAHVVHSEPNAIINARCSLEGCTIYTWPFPPCAECAKLIIQAGIRQVVCPPPSHELEARWGDKLRLASAMLREAGVRLSHVDAKRGREELWDILVRIWGMTTTGYLTPEESLTRVRAFCQEILG